MQVLLFRFRALEFSHARLDQVRDRLGVDERSPTMSAVRESLEGIFKRWSRAPDAPAFAEQRSQLANHTEDLREELDRLAERKGVDENLELLLWAELGSVRGLVEGTGVLQDALLDIRWDQWKMERF
jgi:hypothetical protein